MKRLLQLQDFCAVVIATAWCSHSSCYYPLSPSLDDWLAGCRITYPLPIPSGARSTLYTYIYPHSLVSWQLSILLAPKHGFFHRHCSCTYISML